MSSRTSLSRFLGVAVVLPLLALLAFAPRVAAAEQTQLDGGAEADGGATEPSALVANSTLLPEARPRYFYFGRDYGTQAEYGPLWVFLNRGYDVIQDHVVSRNIFKFNYGTNLGNVAHNFIDPFPAIHAAPWHTFLVQEIFPLSYTKDTARWVPNYTLHLLGGGITYTGLTEWFRDYDVPAPRVFSIAVLMSAAFINESLENKGVVGYNTDCIADLWFFDIGGIILFSFDFPNWFFSHEILLADWSQQPSFVLPNGELHDVGNYFSAKWPLPFYRRLALFSWYGEAQTFGLSFKLNDEYAISAAAGGTAVHLVNSATRKVENTVVFTDTAAVFLDRNNSLLASLQVTDTDDYFINLNVYPHAFTRRGPLLGFWGVMDKRGRVAAGLAIGRPFGVGTGWSGL